jgi:PIN domain nuclease of toxin-antitoxin system
MKILLDTHIFLWMLTSPERLNDKRRYELETPANEVFLSAMSIAELMIKHAIGKIQVEFDPIEMAKEMRIEILSFSGDHSYNCKII